MRVQQVIGSGIALMVVAGVAALSAPAIAQTDYENFVIAPGFTPDPLVGTGAIGGPVMASDLTGVIRTETGSCVGYIDDTPDHVVTLRGDFDYLNLVVDSAVDTSLVVIGPNNANQGIWCFAGANPSIWGEWEAGTYDVYVGNLDGPGVGARYRLSITELE